MSKQAEIIKATLVAASNGCAVVAAAAVAVEVATGKAAEITATAAVAAVAVAVAVAVATATATAIIPGVYTPSSCMLATQKLVCFF